MRLGGGGPSFIAIIIIIISIITITPFIYLFIIIMIRWGLSGWPVFLVGLLQPSDGAGGGDRRHGIATGVHWG